MCFSHAVYQVFCSYKAYLINVEYIVIGYSLCLQHSTNDGVFSVVDRYITKTLTRWMCFYHICFSCNVIPFRVAFSTLTLLVQCQQSDPNPSMGNQLTGVNLTTCDWSVCITQQKDLHFLSLVCHSEGPS